MRTLKITLVTLIVIGAVGMLATLIAYGFNVPNMWSDMSSASAYVQNENDTFNDVTGINVTSRDGRINVIGHDKDYVRVVYFTREDRLAVTTTLTNGTLTINQTTERWRIWNFGFNLQSLDLYTIRLYVPTGLENITLQSHNGRVNVSGVESDELRITCHNGRVGVTNSEIDQINITSHNGSIHVTNVVGDRVILNNHNGSNTINGKFNHVDSQTLNGRNNVTLVGGSGDYEIRLATRNGTNRINGTRTQQTIIDGGPGFVRLVTSNGRNDLWFVA